MPGFVLDMLQMEVQEGQLEVLIEGQVIRVLAPGDSFGEVTALWLFDCLRAEPRQSRPLHSIYLF